MSQESQEDVLLDVEVEEVEVDHHDSQMVSQMSEDEVDESQNVGEGQCLVVHNYNETFLNGLFSEEDTRYVCTYRKFIWSDLQFRNSSGIFPLNGWLVFYVRL